MTKDLPTKENHKNKKYIYYSLLFLVITIAALIISIFIFLPKNKNVMYKNEIYSKNGSINEIKELVQSDEIYFFDCDFSNLSKIKILDCSYNISVSGNLIYNKETERYNINLNKYSEIALVTNYKIESNNKCFGFSIVSRIKDKDNPVIYNKNSFNSLNQLHENGPSAYQDNSIVVDEIKVSKDFYPRSLNNSCSIENAYLKINSNYRIESRPVELLVHYYSYYDYNTEVKQTNKILTDYFNKNAIYSVH